MLAVDVVDAGREGAKVEFTDDAEHAQWLARVVADADLSLVGRGHRLLVREKRRHPLHLQL